MVPISSTRKAMRSGVMMKALMRREPSLYGAMSPYPVVLSVTVV